MVLGAFGEQLQRGNPKTVVGREHMNVRAQIGISSFIYLV